MIPIGLPVPLAEAVRQQLDEGVEVDARAARELLEDVALWLEMRRPGGDIGNVVVGPLASLAEVTRDAVYGRLYQLRAVRQSVAVTSEADEAASLLNVLLNVLIAADAALRVERRYAQAEHASMMVAVLAELRGDQQGVDAQRGALMRAAQNALDALKSGSSEPIGAVPTSALELMRAELVARLRGEVSTSVREVEELKRVMPGLVDIAPKENYPFGPLFRGPNTGYLIYDVSTGPICDIRRDVRNRLMDQFVARRGIVRELPCPRTVVEIGEQLAVLLVVVLVADAVASIEVAYMDAEARAMSLAAVAQLCGDVQGVAAQVDAVRQAAATVVRMMQRHTDAPSDAQLIDRLLLAQIGS